MKIELTRIEDWESTRHNLPQDNYDSDITELYDLPEETTMSEPQEDNLYGNDSTEIYDQTVEITGTNKINKNNDVSKTKKMETGSKSTKCNRKHSKLQ